MKSGRRFELRRELGRGTFGVVYLADLVSAGGFRKQVALKTLNIEQVRASDVLGRFRDEARLLGLLHHRNIVQADDLVQVNGTWAMVMEYVDGPNLLVLQQALLAQEERMPFRAALDLAAGVAAALDAAWSGTPEGGGPLRVVHRDIKPSNICITPEGLVKVLDFGVARATFQDREARTDLSRFGTISYMSPERIAEGPDLPAGDVYGLGCILYHLLAGRAFGPAPTDEEAFETLRHRKLQELASRMPAGPWNDEVVELLGAMLAWDPSERPTAGVVAAEARALSERATDEGLLRLAARLLPLPLPPSPVGPGPSVLVEDEPTVEPPLPLPVPLAAPPSDGVRVQVVIGLSLALLVLGMVVGWWAGRAGL